MMKWTGRGFFKEDLVYSYILHLGMGMAGFILSFVGYEWNGMDREEGCMHHIIQNGKMERSFVALAIPLLERLALGVRDSLLLLFWDEELGD